MPENSLKNIYNITTSILMLMHKICVIVHMDAMVMLLLFVCGYVYV